MRVEPASVDQILRARDGRMVAISHDVGGVVKDLQRLDPHLKVRFAETGDPPYWAVFWESDNKRDTYLVLTQQAHQSRTGVWEGLDQRIVRQLERIDPHGRSGYDYARELQAQNEQAELTKSKRLREKLSELGEQAAPAVRKDLGATNRITVPRDL